ncbi:MAG: sialate O-acetylesterase [Planctomycetota bacterium]
MAIFVLGTQLTSTATFGQDAEADAPDRTPVQVFILCGQSNMEGKAKLSLLEHQIRDERTAERFAHFHNDGEWVEREDVWIKFLGRNGNLTAGYGSPNCIGPELDFGMTVGDHYEQQVMIIKPAWGGRSLYKDFRSPSMGAPDDAIVASQLENRQSRNPEANRQEILDEYGSSYREMISEVKGTLENIEEYFPGYEGQGYELRGFVWFQGWNDMVNADFSAAYEQNMPCFIRDVREELGVENLPFVIGQLGVGGTSDTNEGKAAFKAAQIACAELEEFDGNVGVVLTDQYWDEVAQEVFSRGWRENLEEWNTVGSDRPYHYLGSAMCYSDIGRAFAERILELQPAFENAER